MSKIIPITNDNVELLAKAAEKFGLPRSVGWLRRCLFDPTVTAWTADPIRGHVSVADDGEIVAVQGYYYQPCYFRQQPVLGGAGCIMGAVAKFGDELLCVLDKNNETRDRILVRMSNCLANPKSLKVSKMTGRMAAPAYRSDSYGAGVADVSMYPLAVLWRVLAHPPAWAEKSVWLMARPVQWCVNVLRLFGRRSDYSVVRHGSFQDVRFVDFWNRFLAANDGVISSREPRRLQWLFDDSLAAGTVTMLAAEKGGQIDGYVIVRACVDDHWVRTYEIMDICAVRNDVKVLRALVVAAVRQVGKFRGVKLIFQGCLPNQEKWLDPFFKRRKRSFPTYLYRANDAEVKGSIESGQGWLLGPFDGERCLGCGGYVDL